MGMSGYHKAPTVLALEKNIRNLHDKSEFA